MKELPIALRIELENMLGEWASISSTLIGRHTLRELKLRAISLQKRIADSYEQQQDAYEKEKQS
jgi:hypothetical protein